jgi:Na+-translocating ferredoxin:NAD+ oxidoreductase RnfG subunit
MNELHGSLFTILQLGLTFSVCAVVWITLMAGLYQLVRDKLHHTHLTQRPRRLLQGQQAN